MKMSERRIKRELERIKKDPSPDWSAGPIKDSDLYKWKGKIIGPKNTPYEGGVFYLNICFPTNYPFEPFTINFTTKIYHPHVHSSGQIHCCDYPYLFSSKNIPGYWNPVNPNCTIRGAFDSLIENLKDIKKNCHSVNPDIVDMFLKNREEFNKTAKKWTKKYARKFFF